MPYGTFAPETKSGANFFAYQNVLVAYRRARWAFHVHIAVEPTVPSSKSLHLIYRICTSNVTCGRSDMINVHAFAEFELHHEKHT